MKLQILAMALLLSACTDRATQDAIILDGTPTAAFKSDLSACQTLARAQRQFDQETAGAAVLGAGAGAVLGALDDEADALGGAIAGALAGGIAGAVHAQDRRDAITRDCLRGRGHRVLG